MLVKALLKLNLNVLFWGILLGLLACKPQSNVPPIANSQLPQQSNALPQNDQSDVIRRMEAERLASENRSQQIAAEITRLENLLKSSQTESSDQRKELQAELDKMKTEREAEAKRLADLEADQKKLQDDLDAAKKENEQLKKQIETGNNTNTGGTVNTGGQTGTVMQNRVLFYKTDCVDVVDASTADGANIVAFPCNKSSNQQFNVETVANNTFRFVAKHSNKCMYVQGASTANGANIQQLSCRRNGDTSELFRFADVNGFDFKLQNVRSGKCLKIQANGNLVQDDCATNYTLLRWATGS